MSVPRRIWQAATIIALIIAVLVIQRTVSGGMDAAYAGRPVSMGAYVGSLIGAVLLVCFAILAGIMAKVTKK